MYYRLTIFIVTLMLLVVLLGCKTKEKPEDVAVKFALTMDYGLLSNSDKLVFDEQFYNEHIKYPLATPMLPITNTYYRVEKHLRDMVTCKASSSEAQEKNTLVNIECRTPEFLDGVLFDLAESNSLSLFDEYKNSLDNLKSLHQDGLLTADVVKMEIKNRAILVSDTGVVYRGIRKDGSLMDSSETKLLIEKNQEIKRLRDSVASIINNSKLSGYTFSHGSLTHRIDSAERFQEVMAFQQEEQHNLERVIEVREQILLLDSDGYYSYVMDDFDRYIKNMNSLAAIKAAFEDLKNGVRFEKLSIERARNGALSLFGTYRYTGTTEIKTGGATALFKDQAGNVIGRQYYSVFFSDLHPAEVHGFGWRIDNQTMAARAASVEIVPASVTTLK